MLEEWLAFADAHPLEFTVQYPPRREYFQTRFRGFAGAVADTPPRLLYLHVPFCEQHCHYCNFAVDISNDAVLHRRYVDVLLVELDTHPLLQSPALRGIDIGGGTPTRLPTPDLIRLIQGLGRFQIDHPFPVSIETTPRIAAGEPDKMCAVREAGVQRISMGVQSTATATLAGINRAAQAVELERAMRHLRDAGFVRVNIDLIFGLPGQDAAAFAADVRRVVALAPDSVTTYDCLYRGKGRVLTRRAETFPSPRRYGQLYAVGRRLLLQAGYHAPYGSLNYARHPDERGTSAYFEGRLLDGLPYLGLGNYASSLLGAQWTFNHRGTRAWIEAMERGKSRLGDVYLLPREENDAKYLLGSLNFGLIDPERFAALDPGRTLESAYATEFAIAKQRGWLTRRGAHWQVAMGRFSRLHQLRALFYPPRARAWLMGLRDEQRLRLTG